MSLSGREQNQEDSLKPLWEENKAVSWLSGNAAQLMVLLNGLILSITAYAILNVFIGQIVQENFGRDKEAVRAFVADSFEAIEQDMREAATLLSLPGLQGGALVDIGEALYHNKNYDAAFLLHRQALGRYVAVRVFEREDYPATISAQNHKDVIAALSAHGKDVRSGLFLLPAATSGDRRLAAVFSLPDREEAGQKGILYAIFPPEALSLENAARNYESLYSLTLRADDGISEVFSFTRVLPEGASRGGQTQHDILNILGSEFTLASRLMLGQREAFLRKVPFLMLLFGITLTLIGTLYVRSNYIQGQRISRLNEEFARKNSALSLEVSEREKLNQALHRAEKENRAIIDSVSDIIFETATDGRILFLNGTWENITGLSPEKSLGRNLFDMLYMQDQSEQRNNFEKLVKGQRRGYRAFTRLRTAEGTFRAVEIAVSMLRQDENNVTRVVGTITDVEERRRAERALSEAEKKYRTMVENAASGIYQVNVDGHYLSANPAMARILGYDTVEELVQGVQNANIDIYCQPQDRERHLRDVLREKDGISVEAQIRRHNGQIIWVQENLRAVTDEEGQLNYYEGSIEDITQRKETELALREAKVQSDLASRAKSEFLANMSHELRTPLNAIIGFSDIIRNQAFGPVGSPEYIDYSRDINESGKRLLQVINDILDVSRVEAGDRQLNESMVDMHKLVKSALELTGAKAESAKMIVSNFVDENAPRLIGESHAIKQMLTNLLSNSIKYTPSGGRISISYEQDDYGQLHLSVTDTGIGLTDKEIEKALSPFGQVNTSHSKAESGTGLGLTLVQSLMTLHGGSFELFSQKGIGTTATLIFPSKRVSPSAPQEEDKAGGEVVEFPPVQRDQ